MSVNRGGGGEDGGTEGGRREIRIDVCRYSTAIISVSVGPVVQDNTAEFLDKEE